MDPIQWLDLPPEAAPTVFPVSRRDPRSYAAHVERARAEEDMRLTEFEAKVQQMVLAKQQQQQATAALPYIAALNINGSDYGQQAARIVQQNPAALRDPGTAALLNFQEKASANARADNARRLVPRLAALDPLSPEYRQQLGQLTAENPDIYEQPVTRDILRDQSYQTRQGSRTPSNQRLVDKALMEYPHLAQAYDDEVATLGETQAARNLYWNAHDSDAENQLATHGFDLSEAKPEALARLRLPDGKHYDPVRVATWIKQYGRKGPEALTPEARDRKLKSLQEAMSDKATALGVSPDSVPIIEERIRTMKADLGMPLDAPTAAAPVVPPVAAPGVESPEAWTAAKRAVLGVIAHAANGDPEMYKRILLDKAARRAALGEIGQRPAVGSISYAQVADVLTDDDIGYFGGPPVQAGQMVGGARAGTQPGQVIPTAARGFTITKN